MVILYVKMPSPCIKKEKRRLVCTFFFSLTPVNFQCRGVLLIWIIVGQGPTAPTIGAGGGCLDIFSLIYNFSFLSPFLWDTAQYRLKYCLKGPLNPKLPTNQILFMSNKYMYKLFENKLRWKYTERTYCIITRKEFPLISNQNQLVSIF